MEKILFAVFQLAIHWAKLIIPSTKSFSTPIHLNQRLSAANFLLFLYLITTPRLLTPRELASQTTHSTIKIYAFEHLNNSKCTAEQQKRRSICISAVFAGAVDLSLD